MASTYITNKIVAKFFLAHFENNLQLTRTVNRQYQDVFSNSTGRTINIREPVRLLATPGRVANLQDVQQRVIPLTIDQRLHVAINFTDEERTLELDSFQDTYIEPASEALANGVDSSLYARMIDVANYVGTAGTAPSTRGVIDRARVLLNSIGVPLSDRYCALSPSDAGSLREGLTGFFDQPFTDDILRESVIGRLAGFKLFEAQNVQRPFVTTVTGTPLVNGTNQTGSSLAIDGLTANQVINKGTVFTIAGVNLVNELSKTNTQIGSRFVVTQTTTADGTGAIAALPIYPAIEPVGQYQNVTSSPADNAAVTFQVQHTLNMAYHKDFMTVAFINLAAPRNGAGAYTENMRNPNAGISVRVTEQFNAVNMTTILRFDVLYGIAVFGKYGCRVLGS